MTELLDDVDVVDVRGDPATTEVTLGRVRQPPGRRRARCSAACRAPAPTVTTTPPRRWPAGPSALLVRARPRPRRDPGPGGPGHGPPGHGRGWRRAFYGHPARSLTMVGVTGTNGKTTVTHLVAVDPRARRDRRPGSSAPSTGPGPPPRHPVLQRLLAELRDDGPARGGHGGVLPRPGPAPGGRHPLRRRRLHQPEPRPSRLPRDRWRRTSPPRRRSSTRTGPRSAVVNVDDPWGRRLAERRPAPPVVPVRRGRRPPTWSLAVGAHRRSAGGAGR